MNKGRLVSGVICLVLAVLIAVLTIVLPPDKMIFMVGDANVPIAPAVFLALLGLVLIITSR